MANIPMKRYSKLCLHGKFQIKVTRRSHYRALKYLEKREYQLLVEGTKDTGITMSDWWGYKLVHHCGEQFPMAGQLNTYIHTESFLQIVYNSFSQNYLKLETMEMPINWLMTEQAVVHPSNESYSTMKGKGSRHKKRPA